jgi:integrase
MSRRELLPATLRYYAQVLEKAFGPDWKTLEWRNKPLPEEVLTWPESQKPVLRGAITHATARLRDFDVKSFLWDFGGTRYRSNKAHIPGEVDVSKYERAAGKLPLGQRAMALLPLAMGFRASELVTFSRDNTKHAVASGECIILGKGDKERILDCTGAVPLFEELLAAPSFHNTEWTTAGGIICPWIPEMAYFALYRLVRDTGASAGIPKCRPHILRHAFATRLMRDGASLALIQYALGHTSPTTTSIYVHPSKTDLAGKMRSFGAKEAPPAKKEWEDSLDDGEEPPNDS